MVYRNPVLTAYCLLFLAFVSVSFQSCPVGYGGSPCKDIQPPSLKCPDPIITNTSKGKPTSNIAWSVQVTDNSAAVNPNAVIKVRSSHESGQELPIGRTDIKVTATDEAGNVATCEFPVEVKDTEPPSCGFCPSDIIRDEVRDEVRVNWDRPICSDNSGQHPVYRANRQTGAPFRVPSTFVVKYEVGDPADNYYHGCSFKIILKVKTCPSSPPPRNGALACLVNERNPVCAAMCRTGTDFEFNPPLVYYCSGEQWNFFGFPGMQYVAKTPWPNCSDTAKPSSIKKYGFSHYYYSGNAHDPRVQEAIKSQFMILLEPPFLSPFFCTFNPKCTKDNISVSAGVIS